MTARWWLGRAGAVRVEPGSITANRKHPSRATYACGCRCELCRQKENQEQRRMRQARRERGER